MAMKFLLTCLLALLPFNALAETQVQVPAPTQQVASPQVLSDIQKKKVAERAAQVKKQIADLSVPEKQALVRALHVPKAKLSPQQKMQRQKSIRENWAKKTSDEKSTMRTEQRTRWEQLPPEEKSYRRERMAEQLKALPDADRQAILDQLKK